MSKGDKILEAVSERRTHDLKKLVSEINADQNLKDLIVKLPLACFHQIFPSLFGFLRLLYPCPFLLNEKLCHYKIL